MRTRTLSSPLACSDGAVHFVRRAMTGAGGVFEQLMACKAGDSIDHPPRVSPVGRRRRRPSPVQLVQDWLEQVHAFMLKCVKGIPCIGQSQIRYPTRLMVTKGERKPRLWKGPGWSPERTKRFMEYGRDWKPILRFYQQMVAGEASLMDIGLASGEEMILGADWSQKICDLGRACDSPAHQNGEYNRRGCRRITYKVGLSYYGPYFHGWARYKDHLTVEKALSEKIEEILPDANVLVATSGRTDRAVSSCAQVVSFYGWRSLPDTNILNALNSIAPGKLRAWWAEQVPRKFHATFSANWRRYVYLFPLRKGNPRDWGHLNRQLKDEHLGYQPSNGMDPFPSACDASQDEEVPDFDGVDQSDVDVEKANQILQKLVGQPMDYYSFARDTPKGKECTCTLLKAQAFLVGLNDAQGGVDALCIELVGDRFLRKMVRVLVSTTLREASWGSSRGGSVDALLEIADEKNRVMSAQPAPACGLCFAGAGYETLD